MKYLTLLPLLSLLFCYHANADVLQFEAGSNLINFGTYSESGYTFTQSSFQVNVEDGSGGDGVLAFRTFTNGTPGALLTNDGGALFDLESLEVDSFGISQTFTATASSGAVFTFTGTGLVDFSTAAGDWTNLSSVNFQYSGSSTSESITLDNITVNKSAVIPEPGSIVVLASLGGLAWMKRRRDL